MKKLFCLSLLVILISCKKEKIEKDKAEPQEKEILTELYGSWVGDFVVKERDTTKEMREMYSNKINIVIKKITENRVIGQSIVAGNNRRLEGKMTKNGSVVHFILNEPGDDKNDGVFDFEIKDNKVMTGIWVANNRKKEVYERSFELTKRDFKYDPTVMLSEDQNFIDYVNPKEQKVKIEDEDDEDNGQEYSETTYRVASELVYTINSSTQKLKESDLKNLKKIDLEILRNTIFARHGLTFKTKTVRQFFNGAEWYIPISSNVNNELTSTEKQNIAILKRFEKYAEDNYDSFGR